jgi:serine/threonine protein kinase
MTTSAHRPSEPPYIGAIGPYHVIERLALGGMGTTYLARREGETMLRVVKLGHPDLPKEDLIDARLAREAAVGLRLRHPNVAALVDTGVTEQGRLYLVFEYVAGPRLTRVLESWYARGARPPIDVAVGLALQLLEGLHHIHEARDESGALLYAVHRDVGPNNVMLEPSGVPKLIDLGLVSDARSDWRTESRVVVGTAQYVAPEIARGGAKYADRRADLYSMGVLLYELLLAEPIFAVGTGMASILGQLIAPQHARLKVRRPDVPPALDAVVMRALAANPDERWPHAVAFSSALRQACAVAGLARIAAHLAPELEAHREATAHRTSVVVSPEITEDDDVASPTSLGQTPHGTQLVRRRPGPMVEPEVVVSPEAALNSSEMLREVVPTRVLPRRDGGSGVAEVGWPKRWVVAVGVVWTVVCVGGTWVVATMDRQVLVDVGPSATPEPTILPVTPAQDTIPEIGARPDVADAGARVAEIPDGRVPVPFTSGGTDTRSSLDAGRDRPGQRRSVADDAGVPTTHDGPAARRLTDEKLDLLRRELGDLTPSRRRAFVRAADELRAAAACPGYDEARRVAVLEGAATADFEKLVTLLDACRSSKLTP